MSLQDDTDTQLTDSGLTENRFYTYAFFTRDRSNNTSTAASVTSSTDVTAPNPVTDLAASQRAATAITLSWSNPQDQDLAEVIIRRAEGATPPTSVTDGSPVTPGSPTATTVTDTGLTVNSTYSYAVFTRDTTGNTRTPPITITTSTDVTAPGPISALTVTNRTTSSISLAWTNPSDLDLDAVIVRRATGATAPTNPTAGTAVPLGSPTATTVTDTGLANNTTYSYAVFTKDAAENTSAGLTVTSSTDVTAPGPVTSPKVQDRTADAIRLYWALPGNADDLAEVIVRRAEGSTAPATITEGTNVPVYYPYLGRATDTGLTVDTTYSYSIFTRDRTGNTNHAAATITTSTVGVVSVSPGPSTCALLTDGTVRCWGDNSKGQLGDGTTTDRNRPAAVAGLSDIKSVDVGSLFACALETSGKIWCWGDGQYGQLGNGATNGSKSPVAVSGISDAVALAVGGSHACALSTQGTVKCWGGNWSGQTGDGSALGPRLVPVPLYTADLGEAANEKVTEISAGADHSCALLETGKVVCWGDNRYRQVGDICGPGYLCATPIVVPGPSNIVRIFAGDTHNCVLDASESVYCWGSNGKGELGDGTTQHSRSAWMPVVGLSSGVTDVGLGESSSCVVLQGATIDCWGDNYYGQLGIGEVRTTHPSAVRSALAVDAASVEMGQSNGCSIQAIGNLWCWGTNDQGQIGDESLIDRTIPVAVRIP